jgi:hypothetical protein
VGDIQVVSVDVEQVALEAGQRYFVVRAADGRRYRIADDRLQWVARLVFTSIGNRWSYRVPVTLVTARKASAVGFATDPQARILRVACRGCGRADSASLFMTVRDYVDDIYFTHCRRCWRSCGLAVVRRQRPQDQLAYTGHQQQLPVRSTRAAVPSARAFLVVFVAVVVVFGGLLALGLNVGHR